MKKNKIVKIFIIVMLLVSVQLSVIAASTGVVNVETVRVREKATTDSAIVELVSIGDKITITGEEGNWYKVKVGKVEGYIRKDLLTVEDTTNTTGTPNTSNNNNDNNEDKPTNNNNNEEQPTTNSSDNQETPTTDTPTTNTTDTNTATNVEENDRTISTIKAEGSISVGQKIKLTEKTKIKILPLANSSNIAELQANTEVTVLEVINSWCRIETEGACGWVRIDQ